MLGKNDGQGVNRQQFELVCLEDLVPQDHLLRLIDTHIDFSFIREKVRPFYCENNGRPSLDPVLLFKMMLIGYLYGIRSERRLEQEIKPNVIYRWFLGLSLTDPVPDHSTISWNRTKRFAGTSVFQDVFDEVVRLAMSHNLIGGRVLFTDSTHIQANASSSRYTMQAVTETPQAYLQELEQAVNEDREAHGKKPLSPAEETPSEKLAKCSTTDPDSGYMTRKGKPEGFHYLDHRTVDHKYNLITDVHVTAGNVNDSTVYLERLKRQIDTFGFTKLEAVALDSGYMAPSICHMLQDMNIQAAIPTRTGGGGSLSITKGQFAYEAASNVYHCPEGQVLRYKTTNRAGYRVYESDPEQCQACPLRDGCTTNQQSIRTIQRHVWEDSKEWASGYLATETGQMIYTMRREMIERSFGDAKELFGFRRCRMRGREKVQEQALMTAVAQNLKKIARILARKAATFGTNCKLAYISLENPGYRQHLLAS